MLNILMGDQCQSCGMPLKKDEQGGGTEQDGSISKLYCSKCYKNGSFTNKTITAEGMKELVANKMKDMKMPGFLVRYFTKDIPSLKRWEK